MKDSITIETPKFFAQKLISLEDWAGINLTMVSAFNAFYGRVLTTGSPNPGNIHDVIGLHNRLNLILTEHYVVPHPFSRYMDVTDDIDFIIFNPDYLRIHTVNLCEVFDAYLIECLEVKQPDAKELIFMFEIRNALIEMISSMYIEFVAKDSDNDTKNLSVVETEQDHEELSEK